MKIYFLCEESDPQWWVCHGFLSNGFCFGQHVCSNPCFAAHDLLTGRLDRKAALKEIFDISEPFETETIIIRTGSDLPAFFKESDAMQPKLKEAYEKYHAMLGIKPQSNVEVTFTDDIEV